MYLLHVIYLFILIVHESSLVWSSAVSTLFTLATYFALIQADRSLCPGRHIEIHEALLLENDTKYNRDLKIEVYDKRRPSRKRWYQSYNIDNQYYCLYDPNLLLLFLVI